MQAVRAPLPSCEKLDVGHVSHVSESNLYLPAVHTVQVPLPPLGPVEPELQTQAEISPLPGGEDFPVGHSEHEPGFKFNWYFPAAHMLQASPYFPI
jgi:hypothetical protein